MLKAYDEYQDTNIRWNNSTPKHWQVKRSKNIFQNKKELNSNHQSNNVLSLTLRGVINNDIDNPIGLSPKDYATYQLFKKNDLVFKLIDLENYKTSRVGLVHEDGIMSSAYIRFSAISQLSINYFYYQYYDLYLRGIYNDLGNGVRSTLSCRDLLDLQIVIPTINEQYQIVRYLDAKVSKINRLISAKKKEIEMLTEYKTRLISDVVTGKVDVRGIHVEDVPEAELIEEFDEEIVDEFDDETSEEENIE